MTLGCIKLRENLRFPDYSQLCFILWIQHEQFQQTQLRYPHQTWQRCTDLWLLASGRVPSLSFPQREDFLRQEEPRNQVQSICFPWDFAKEAKCWSLEHLLCIEVSAGSPGGTMKGSRRKYAWVNVCICPMQLRITHFVIVQITWLALPHWSEHVQNELSEVAQHTLSCFDLCCSSSVCSESLTCFSGVLKDWSTDQRPGRLPLAVDGLLVRGKFLRSS